MCVEEGLFKVERGGFDEVVVRGCYEGGGSGGCGEAEGFGFGLGVGGVGRA